MADDYPAFLLRVENIGAGGEPEDSSPDGVLTVGADRLSAA
jgi:hypothetical protein